MPDESIRLVHASGACEIDLAARELRVLGSPVPVGGRAFEIIEVLARSAGELVTKNELIDRIWPGAIVSENTLHVHAGAIRKALGPNRDLLKTVSGRGYRLDGEWTVRRHDAARPPVGRQRVRVDGDSPVTNFPAPVTRLVGRTAAVAKLRDLMSAYRVVTLTGPGGIGKTSLALKAARGVVGEFADGGWLVELASLSDPGLVSTTVAAALRLPAGRANVTPETIARSVGDNRLLLVLDNCEHLIATVAILAETLLAHCPRTTIIATSREILRIQGEYVYRVAPLEVPAAERDDADHILNHSAVELFITRIRALDTGFSPHARELPSIGGICRHLDGIPLAIEFAATRAATLGVETVLAQLHDRFALLTSGRRTALPRHRTLRAVLDWSYELLTEAEQRLLRHVAIFSGGFTIDAAAAVLSDGAVDRASIVEDIGNLVNKSLVTLEREVASRWHLLETTRVHGLEKLEDSGEASQAARRQAEFCLALFAPFGTEGQLQAALADLARYRIEIDNLRAALNWAFSTNGDAALGVALAAAAADFWAALSLMPEACEWAEKALARIGEAVGTHREMVLQCSRGMALIFSTGMVDPARDALARGSTLARTLADLEYQQRTTLGLWLFEARSSALHNAMAIVSPYEAVVRSDDRQSRAVADWLTGIPHIYFGEHIEASTRLLRAIDRYPIEHRFRDRVRFGGDLLASASGHVAVSLLSRGLVEAAARAVTRAVEEARGTNQTTVLCTALAFAAGFISLTLGELELAGRYGEELILHAEKHELLPFHAAGLCVRGSLAARRGAPDTGVDLLRRGLAGIRAAAYLLFCPFFLVELAATLGALGRIDEGLAEIDAVLRFAGETGHRWLVPEALRVKGQLVALRDPDDSAAEDLFRDAINLAHEQEALFWELRAALSLARVRVDQGRGGEVRQLVAQVYDRFTEGFDTPDLRAAKALLDELPAG